MYPPSLSLTATSDIYIYIYIYVPARPLPDIFLVPLGPPSAPRPPFFGRLRLLRPPSAVSRPRGPLRRYFWPSYVDATSRPCSSHGRFWLTHDILLMMRARVLVVMWTAGAQ